MASLEPQPEARGIQIRDEGGTVSLVVILQFCDFVPPRGWGWVKLGGIRLQRGPKRMASLESEPEGQGI